jgi:hypothetical protein
MAYVANMEPIDPYRTPEFFEAIAELKSLNPKVYGDTDNWEEYAPKGPYREVKKR